MKAKTKDEKKISTKPSTETRGTKTPYSDNNTD